MNVKTLEAVEKHGRHLLAIFPNATERDPVALCKKLRRVETVAHRYVTDQCNGLGPSMDSVEHDANIYAFHKRLNKILGTTYGERGQDEPPIHVNLDPRGYALKIDNAWMRANDAKLYTDWGGYGIIAPNLTQN